MSYLAFVKSTLHINTKLRNLSFSLQFQCVYQRHIHINFHDYDEHAQKITETPYKHVLKICRLETNKHQHMAYVENGSTASKYVYLKQINPKTALPHLD